MDYEPLERLEAVNLWEMDDLEQFFGRMLKFQFGTQHGEEPGLSIKEVEELVSLFFEQWSVHIPILVKEEFYRYFGQFKENALHSLQLLKTPLQGPALAARRDKIISYKIFGCLLLMLCQMGLLTKIKSERLIASHKYHRLASYYHRAVSLAYMNPYFGVFSTSLQSLQFLSLVLFYFLNVGNISAIYDLRGRVVSMAQQLRLHRCPSAVLGGAGSTMDKREQGDRRVLFWGIYYLDVFSALQLGVPRLIKDFEIECALPVSDNDDRTVNLAGQQIRLEGRVTQFSLAIIRFAKVLGNILDSIFKRGMTESITKQVSLIHENALDNWRRGLPQELMFELDVNGTINMDEFNKLKQMNATVEHSENIVLLVMYFLAKCMIHLPVVATRPLPTNEPGESNDTAAAASAAASASASSGHAEVQKSLSEVSQAERSSSSYVLLQQATNTMLNVLESLKSIYLPMPLNISRTKARFALLSARGSLEYIKGGALFLDNKSLLLNVIQDLEEDRKLELPGVISWNSLKLLDMSINLLLQPPNTEVEKLDKLLKKKLNHYNRLMGRPIVKSEQSSKTANLTPASSKGDEDTPPAKRVKIEEPVMPPPSNHEQAIQVQHESHPQQPVSTQTAFAEALQLDPVLNGNSFGGHGLNSTLYDMPQHHTNHPQVQEPQLNAQSSDKLHGLFKVPSTADLLMDDPANSQLNMLLNTGELGGLEPVQPSTFTNLNSGFSGLNLSNLFGLEGSAAQGGAPMGSGQRQQPDTGFNFAVDASLGLAPLLAWTPDRNSIVLDPMNEGGDLHSDQHQTALPPHQQQLQQQQQQLSEEQQPQESEEDLSMRKRSHRSRGRGRPRKHEENLHDLFCWQNSK
ncbi:uncharacterized protein ZBAI_05483 [Zygosaccharomyces bailii ISA1307]|nr:uncharacterized protein ZBAI_05483 [Zygosaccharomyces bailii ISA1307]